MDHKEHVAAEEAVQMPRPQASRIRPLTLREHFQQRRQARRLRQMLREWEQEHGPITDEMLERVRRVWPADSEEVVEA